MPNGCRGANSGCATRLTSLESRRPSPGSRGVPSWDSGFASDPPSKITYEIDASDTWLLGIIPIVTGQKIDKVKISVEGDGIIEDTLKIRDAVTKLGLDVVGRSGTIEL